MSRQNYENKYFNKGNSGPPNPNMNWGMYGGFGSSPGRGGYHGQQGYGPPSGQGPPGPQFGRGGGSHNNFRGGGYSRHGPDRGSDYFVPDEAPSPGASASPFSHRKAPPAHAGSQYPGFPGPGHLFGGPPPPPSAHGYPPPHAYPPGFGYGYSGYGNWDGFNQPFHPNQNQGLGKPKDRDYKEREGDNRDSTSRDKDSRESRDQRDPKDLRDSRDSRDSKGFNNPSEGANMGSNLSPPSLTVTKIPGPNYPPKSQSDLSISPERHPQRSPGNSQYDFTLMPAERQPSSEPMRSSSQMENSYHHPNANYRQDNSVSGMSHQSSSRPPTASPTSKPSMDSMPLNKYDPDLSPFSRPPSGASTSSKTPSGFSPTSVPAPGFSPNSRPLQEASPLSRQFANNSPSSRPLPGTSPASHAGNSRPPSSNSRPASHSSAEMNPLNILTNNPFSRPPSQGSLYEFDRIMSNDSGPVSPNSLGFFNSRRKQSTPTKKPTLPGEPSTVLITHAGQPPPSDSPVEDIFQFPQDLGPSNPDHSVNIPATSSLRSVRKQSLKKADILVSPKYDFDPKILQFNSNDGEPEKQSNEKDIYPNSGVHQNTEGDFADKESDDEDLSLKAVIRKKRSSKVGGYLEESDSELETKNKSSNKRNTKSKNKAQAPKIPKSPTFAVPKSSPRTMKKSENYSTESEMEGADGSKIGNQRRSSNEDTPQRRRSKGEMKEFPTSAEKAAKAELFQKLEEDLEAMFEEKKDDSKAEVFQKVEDDLEAMFAGLEDKDDDIPETKPTPGAVKRKSKLKTDSPKNKTDSPKNKTDTPKNKKEPKVKPEIEKKKRGRKPKVPKKQDSDSDDGEIPEVVPARSKSKRKSAQNAELRFRESNSDDEDFLMKRYFKNDSNPLPSVEETKLEEPAIEVSQTNIDSAEVEKEPRLNGKTTEAMGNIDEEVAAVEEIIEIEPDTKIETNAEVEEEPTELRTEEKPINLAVNSIDNLFQDENKPKQTMEESKPEIVLETSVIRPKKLTRAMQESMLEMNKMKNEENVQSLGDQNSPIVIDDTKPDIIEINANEIPTPTPPAETSPVEIPPVEVDSSNQEEEAENLSLAERRGRKKQPKMTIKQDSTPIEDAIDLSVSEALEKKDVVQTPVEPEAKTTGRKGRRSQRTKDEDVKPEEEIKENIESVEENKSESSPENEVKESSKPERKSRRSNGISSDGKENADVEMNEDAKKKSDTKSEESTKAESLKEEQTKQEEIIVATRRRKLRRSNDDLDKIKEAEDLSMKKEEVEVVGTRNGRKRKSRVSEEKVTKMENTTTDSEKNSKSSESFKTCDESHPENLQEKDNKLEPSKTGSLPNMTNESKVVEKLPEVSPRGRQLGRRSRPIRKAETLTETKDVKENNIETPNKIENDDQTPEKQPLPNTKKFDIKLKKVDIRTKEGHLPTSLVPSMVDDVKEQAPSDSKDVKESPPPTSRRSRRSKDPKSDDTLNDSNHQTESPEMKGDDNLNQINGITHEKTEPVRRGRKRNLSATDSNVSHTLDTSSDDIKNNKKSKPDVVEPPRPSRRTRGLRSDESLSSTDKNHDSEEKNEEKENVDTVNLTEANENSKPSTSAEKSDIQEKPVELQEIIDVTDDDEITRVDDTDEVSILEIEDSNDVNSDSINELLDSAEASNIESADTSPVRKKRRGRIPGSKNKPKKPKFQDENLDLSKQVNKALKKGKKYTKVEVLLERFKGPFVHIEGSFRSPNFVNVINSSNDSLGPRTTRQRGICDQELRPKLTNFGHSSALSKQYDSRNIDQTWVCVFCHKTSHFRGLGDLFGPYWVPSNKIKTPQKVRKDSQNSESSKKSGRKRRKSEISEVSVEAALPTDDSGKTEIWFHEDCFIWIPNTFLVGGRIVGLEDGVEQCQDLFCSECHNRGASVGCTAHGCKLAAHVFCAEQGKWHMDMHNFDAKCNKHSG